MNLDNKKKSKVIEEVVNRGASIDKLSAIVLFGSCARKDYTDESDIDIAFIIDDTDENMYKYRKKINSIISEISSKYFEDIGTVCISEKSFNEKKKWYPFYVNIEKEGIFYNVK